MASKDPVEALKAFLESTPPNVPVRIPAPATEDPLHGTWYVSAVPKRLQIHCDVDDGVRRFDASKQNSLFRGVQFLEYVCRDCGESKRTYALLTVLEDVGGEYVAEVMKLGEYPPFGTPISTRIQKLLGKDDLELYRKGSRAEAQGLGIGAATYFRRIVDSHWKLLVTELRRAAETLGHTDLAVFDNALQETQFSAAVRMLNDARLVKILERPAVQQFAPFQRLLESAIVVGYVFQFSGRTSWLQAAR